MLALSIALVGCDAADGEGEPAPIDIRVGTLQSACAGDGNPVSATARYRVCGQASVNLPNVGPVTRRYFDRVVQAQGGRLDLQDLPANASYEVTVVRLDEDDRPLHLARERNVGVTVRETNDVSMTLVPYNETACLRLGDAGNLPHRVFPAVAPIGGGRLLVTGGFSLLGSTEAGAPPDRLTAPSQQTWIVNPRTGQVRPGPQLIRGRAAHAMIHVPARNALLVIGGLTEMRWTPGEDRVAFRHDPTRALASVELIDLSSGEPVVAGEIEMQRQRAFPRPVLVGGDRVVVTGGGGWPAPAQGFAQTDYIVWSASENIFRVQTMLAQDIAPRAGHSITLVASEVVDGSQQDTYLLWGGTPGDSRASLLVASADPNREPFFQVPALQGAATERTAFHSAVALRNGRVLAVGGATFENNDLRALRSQAAYRLTYARPGAGQATVAVEQLAGFPSGRFFHTASSHDGARVAIVGGFTALDGAATGQVVYFDGSNFTLEPAPLTPLAPRGGHAAAFTGIDALYLAGGIESVEDLLANEAVLSELFVPASVGFCDAPVFDESELEGN